MEGNLIDILTSSVLTLIMLGVGLSLSLRNFSTVITKPRAIFLGLFMQMGILPLLAFILCMLFSISPEFKVGIIILAACPGGTTSNYIIYLLNSNTALAIVLTIFNSLLSLISIPLLIHFALLYFTGTSLDIVLPVGDIVLSVFFIIIVPVVLGVIIHEKFTALTEKINSVFVYKMRGKQYSISYLKLITLILLGLVFAIKLLGSKSVGGADLELNDFKELLPIGLALNIAGLLSGYLVSILLKFKSRTALTIGIQVGLQNTTLSFLIAASIIGNIEIQKPALIYAFFSFWTTVLFGMIVKLITGKKVIPN